MAVLVSDSFNRANGALGNSDTGQTWQTSTANFVVSSNKGTVSALDNTQFAYIDTGQSDVTVTADFSSTGSPYSDCPKFLFRATNFTNGYVVRWDGTNWVINKLVNGSLTALGSYASSGPNSTNIITVKVTCSGNTINLYLNGTSVLTVTDSTFAGTNHGWGTMRVQGLIDNFLVEGLATGTTYSGGGTASGVASANSTEVQIYAGTGTTSGAASASSSEHFIYTATGTASGVGSASSSETVIAASTTYSGSGTASGTSSASSTETVTFASSGTAQGSASVVGNVAVPTTYTDSGTASGIASASSTETLISSRGVPLNRSYVFLDAARLNPIQVDTNLKVVFDYLNSFVIGIGNIVAATSTSFTVTGLSQTNTQYLVTVIPSWNTTYWITGKTTSGFTINFGTAPASDSTLDWRLMR